jgi:hypothetical protein
MCCTPIARHRKEQQQPNQRLRQTAAQPLNQLFAKGARVIQSKRVLPALPPLLGRKVGRLNGLTPTYFAQLIISISLLCPISGCASTKVETSGLVPGHPLCQAKDERISALALWQPQWRPDQKNVPLREASAQRGIELFFSESGCYSKTDVLRPVPQDRAGAISDEEALGLAANHPSAPSRLIVITVRELGPVVKLFGFPALVEGGTEVVLELRALDVTNGRLLANFRSHWQNGGAFVIKGVASLEQDMRAALTVALQPLPVDR